MILVSRPPDVPTPFPIHTLDDDLLTFLERPNEDNAAAGGGLPVTTTTPNSPETRDRLLAYAYLIYDAAVTRQLPQGSIPPGHSALLLPLMEVLQALHPHNPSIDLLLGCVYYHYDLTQRSLEINGHILQYDPQNVSAMCNMGVILRFMDRLVQAFEWWWKALQLFPISWDILDNMLEIFLGFKDFGNKLPEVHDDHNTPHTLQIRRQSLQVCNFVMGHLPGHQLKMEEIYRAQNTFRLRVLLLRYFQEAGDWEDIAEGIELGINTTVTPPAGSVRPKETTLDDLLLQVHCIGKSVCGITDTVADEQEGFDGVGHSSEVHGQELLQPTLLLFPEEVMRLPLALWPSTNGSLPSITISAVPGNLQDGVRMESLKAPTNIATSRLLRAWAMGVQGFLGTGPSTSRGQATPAAVPCSRFQATQSLVILAEYLALSLHPTTASYNDLGILLSSVDNQRRDSQPSGPNSTKETTGRNLSRLYFEAGLEIDPCNAHLLANLGSYWKKEGDYEEAIRYYQLALALNPEFTAPRVYLEQALSEIGQDLEGVREEPIYQKFD